MWAMNPVVSGCLAPQGTNAVTVREGGSLLLKAVFALSSLSCCWNSFQSRSMQEGFMGSDPAFVGVVHAAGLAAIRKVSDQPGKCTPPRARRAGP